jgi:hypothetical protein
MVTANSTALEEGFKNCMDLPMGNIVGILTGAGKKYNDLLFAALRCYTLATMCTDEVRITVYSFHPACLGKHARYQSR